MTPETVLKELEQRTRADALRQIAADAARREKHKWLEYWRNFELQIPTAAREKIMKTLMVLQARVVKGKLQEKRAKEYHHILLKIGVLCDGNMDNPSFVEGVLKGNFGPSQRYLQTAMTAYNYYRRANNIKRELDMKVDRRRPLPILTPESTLKAAIPTAKKLWWQAYFRLLYEAGPRPSEPFTMKKQDVNFDQELVRLGTAKGSGKTLQRELPISPLLCEQLRTLTINKDAEEYVFTKPYVPDKTLSYNDACHVMGKIRDQLKQSGYNTRGLVLYVFRHAFATRLYHGTKDLPLVSRSLGHRSLETTMLYIHMHPENPRRYDVENCKINDKKTISLKIAEGWELALQTRDTVFFKRPRWVP